MSKTQTTYDNQFLQDRSMRDISLKPTQPLCPQCKSFLLSVYQWAIWIIQINLDIFFVYCQLFISHVIILIFTVLITQVKYFKNVHVKGNNLYDLKSSNQSGRIVSLCIRSILKRRDLDLSWPSGKLPFDCQKIAKNLTFFQKKLPKIWLNKYTCFIVL